MRKLKKGLIVAHILNCINQETIEIELSEYDIKTLLRFRKIFSGNISDTKPFDEFNIIKIKIYYGNFNWIQLFGGQMFISENNILEYYNDKNALAQNYIINLAYKNNYDRLKQVVYLDSAFKK